MILPHLPIRPRCPAVEKQDAVRLYVAFAGGLRGNRQREELRFALESLLRERPEARTRLEVAFHLDRPSAAARRFVASLPASPRLVVNAGEARLDPADLLIDLESEPDHSLLLTKVAVYIGHGKPIWALCSRGGTTWSLLDRYRCGYLSALGSPAAAAQTLLTIWDDWKSGRLEERKPSPELLFRFAPERALGDLQDFVRSLRAAPLRREASPADQRAIAKSEA
jgi:hypothetical protein